MFNDRGDAGKRLAEKLKSFKNKKDAVVLGITRGGVVVAFEIARILHLPLDLIVIKKIGAPHNPELAIGAVGPNKSVFWDEDICRGLAVSKGTKKQLLEEKNKEREDLERKLRLKKSSVPVFGKHVILADDGVATGATVLAGAKFLRKEKTKSIILAVPVISKDTLSDIKNQFDRVISLAAVKRFGAVGEFYLDFPQVGDEEVLTVVSRK